MKSVSRVLIVVALLQIILIGFCIAGKQWALVGVNGGFLGGQYSQLVYK